MVDIGKAKADAQRLYQAGKLRHFSLDFLQPLDCDRVPRVFTNRAFINY